jgi:DNA polymerase III epsilon subunit-like protein
MDYKTLHKKTVAELREMAHAQFPDIEGTSAMHKDKLLEALCARMGIDRHGHHEAVVAGVSIPDLKKKVHALKGEKAKALSKGDRAAVKKSRKEIHKLKHKMRRLVSMATKT